MSGVYTTRFVASGGAGIWVPYTVPAGQRAIVTSILTNNTGGATGLVGVNIANMRVVTQSLASLQSAGFQCRATAFSGEKIEAFAEQAHLRAVVNGYLFSDASFSAEELQDGQLPYPEGADRIVGEP